eukprot:CAMPEP_0196720048 /NCGR_PEP_ID=MMETSP1091-20130531/2903_1 /TAXON_ID=302021 /ORGANISM="Rhodomonas sp., Strain CCMP768" /LENGTH=217 /DNA_ID=CAMNT_0042061161 /DNA_START=60 /DNA_END=713 /DNA_ORIENTATION=+
MAVVALCFISHADAFSTAIGSLPALKSTLSGGHVLPAQVTSRSSASVCGSLQMGKGKKTPINQRGEMMKRQQMAEMQQQMMGDDSDGLPVFTVYTRTKTAQVWYPCGSLKGDQRSRSLVEAWRDNSLFLKGQYKTTLDKGMAKSVFEQRDRFIDSIVRLYPQLKKSRADLEFGYKVKIPGLEEKLKEEGREDELKITIITEEGGGLLDGLKSSFGLS